HDNASVTGAVQGFPIPTVSFTFGAANVDCTGNAIANAAQADQGFTASSINTAALGAGNYNFRASVAGNANYLGATSECEPLTITTALLAITPTTSAGPSPSPASSPPHNTAAVAGAEGFSPTPAVTFTFGAANLACTGNAIANAAQADQGFTASSINTAAL